VHPGSPIEQAATTIEKGPPAEALPPSWEPFLSAMRFAARPQAETLAVELRKMAGVADYAEVRQYATHAPWPLSALLLSTWESGELRGFAEAAEKGYFGDVDDWLAAEQRWLEEDVRESDIAYPHEGAVPYDARIDTTGFPLGAVTLSVGGQRHEAARVAMRWLKVAKHGPTRGRIAFVVFWLLGGFAEDRRSRITAASLAQALRPGDIEEGRSFHLDALNNLIWSQRLDFEEIRMLDELGSGVAGARNFRSPRLDPDLFNGLLRAWRENPERTGLYRLLALGMPLGVSDDTGRSDLLAPEISGAIAPARALLGLKFGERLTPEGCAALCVSPHPWFECALWALEGARDIEIVEDALAMFDRQLGAWPLRKTVMLAARELIAKRSSHLRDPNVWESLELFELPQLAPSGG
jgi:hypothetical protein